jgi:asparagine synthase (glutamine-hydrolysing)
MCGIAGFWSEPAEAVNMIAIVRRMTGAISHRGPDDEGHWCDPQVGIALGHRRLAVLDVSPLGHQPMRSCSGRYQIVFNGEIYNFEELREELVNGGERFRGGSDTEVMLAGFERWGIFTALRRFVGMFAFAVWDHDERKLYLCRDRFGEKPLYFGWMGSTLLFGSDLAALRQHPDCTCDIDRDVLAKYFRYGYVPSPGSIYSNISKVDPGSSVVLSRNGQDRSTHTFHYWKARDMVECGLRSPFEGSDEDATDALETAIRRGVDQEMVSDVPLGAFLSGGLDSSTIVAIMQSLSVRPVRTFTIGFKESTYDESGYASKVAAQLGTDHFELLLSPAEAMAVIHKLPWLYSEPFADPSQIPTFLVAEFARRHVTVALSGDGADELLGGYDRYYWGERVWTRLSRLPQSARSFLAAGLSAISPNSWDRVNQIVSKVIPDRYQVVGAGEKCHKLAAMLTARSRDSLYTDLISICHHSEDVVLPSSETVVGLPENSIDSRNMGFMAAAMFQDTVSYLPDDILVKVDRAAMGVSLETRAPFLDHRIAELCWRMPRHLKIRNSERKWLLRRVIQRYLPQYNDNRPKMGFAIPLADWLRGPLRPWAEDLLSSDRLKKGGYLNVGYIRNRWAQHLSGHHDAHRFLWSVLMFQGWLERQ